MYFEKDWMMRQIGQMVEFVARLFFHRDKIEYEVIDENNLSETDLVYRRLVELLSQNEICDAEDYLFERYKAGDGAYLTLALDFYQRLNTMTDNELTDCDFSRDEIAEGLQDILKKEQIDTSVLMLDFGEQEKA